METKRCSQCGEVKGLEGFYTAPEGKYGVGSICRFCISENRKAYRKANHQKVNLQEKIRRKKSTEKDRQRRRVAMKKYMDNLHDIYVIQRLGATNKHQVSTEAIEAKRQQLLVYRALKEFQKLLKEQDK